VEAVAFLLFCFSLCEKSKGISIMKGYDLFFQREKPDFVHDPGFTPFFLKKKGDDFSKESP
jgi:hypothetical protein